jgi:hypothetical protein
MPLFGHAEGQWAEAILRAHLRREQFFFQGENAEFLSRCVNAIERLALPAAAMLSWQASVGGSYHEIGRHPGERDVLAKRPNA